MSSNLSSTFFSNIFFALSTNPPSAKYLFTSVEIPSSLSATLFLVLLYIFSNSALILFCSFLSAFSVDTCCLKTFPKVCTFDENIACKPCFPETAACCFAFVRILPSLSLYLIGACLASF